jgi:adenosylhomocysteine nucleosidase
MPTTDSFTRLLLHPHTVSDETEDASEPSTAVSHAKADVALVAALHMEVAPYIERCLPLKRYSGGDFLFRGLMQDDARVIVVESGPGAKKVERATNALLDGHEPEWVISVGFSGGLTAETRLGHIVVADAVISGTETLKIDLQMSANPEGGLHVGPFYQTGEIVHKVADKQALHARTGAIAVDMESFTVAKICAARRTKFMAIRCISDDLSEDLPPEVLSIFGKSGFLRAGAVIGSLWKRWDSYKDLLRLRDNAHLAARRLGAFLPSIIERLNEK